MKGYTTLIADNGQRAVDLVKERAFDAILMDVRMPVMGGVEAFKKIKQIRPSATIIFTTAFSIEEMVKDVMQDGAYAMLNKPCDLDTIVNMIEKSKKVALLAIVDDDPILRKTMTNVLQKKGYSLIACSSGEEAIAFAKTKPCDIFFLDMKLPVLNGLEVYLEIKKANPAAVVVLMTAYGIQMNELVSQAIEKGAYSCLPKPYEIDEVVRIIETVMDRK